MLKKLEILKKINADSFSKEELKDGFFWLNSEKGQHEIEAELDPQWNAFELDEKVEVDSDKMLQNIKREMKKSERVSVRKLAARYLPYAAILVVALTTFFGSRYYYKHIQMGAYADNYTSFVTENGQRSKVVLPDGTMVMLNSGTTLSYLYNDAEKRSVRLNGQAFFDVAHDKTNPFTVECDGVEVKVLGTRFGVESYSGSNTTSVSLEDGSVELSYGKDGMKKLVPGELGVFNRESNQLLIETFDLENYNSWMNNKLVFKDTPMKEVITVLERWFNVDIDVNDEAVYSSIFTGTITSESYEQVFGLIEFSCEVKCEIQNRKSTDAIPQIIITKE